MLIALYSFLTFLAGLFDAIIGGGGLITIPILTIILKSPIHAVATNKILAFSTSITAFLFLFRRQKILENFQLSAFFTIFIGVICGSSSQGYFPKDFLKYIFLFITPLVLIFIFNKNVWVQQEKTIKVHRYFFLIIAFLFGFYDGAFGPGAGILYFILFLWLDSKKLLDALMISKMITIISSILALVSYGHQGFVNWSVGLGLAIFIIIGTILGVFIVNLHAERVVKPALLLVILGLVIKIYILG